MMFPTGHDNSKDPNSSSDVKVYGYHTYNINRKPSVTRQEFVVKAIIFISIVGVWQMGIFNTQINSSEDLTNSLRGDIIDQKYFTETVGQSSKTSESKFSATKDDHYDPTEMRTAEYDEEWESGSPPILSQPGEAISEDGEGKTMMMEQSSDEEEPVATAHGGDSDSGVVDLPSLILSDTEANEEHNDSDTETMDPSSSLSTDTGTVSPTSTSTATTTSGTSTGSSSDDTGSTPSTAISNQTTVETPGSEKPETKLLDTLGQSESSATANTNLTYPSTNVNNPSGITETNTIGEINVRDETIDDTDSSNTAEINFVGQIDATDGTIITTPNTTTTDGISPEEQQYALWKATKEEFDAIQPWKNESTFMTVDRGEYKQVVKKAYASVMSLVEDVYTDCEMYILPALETGVEDPKWDGKPRVQFKCLGESDPVLTDDLCHTVNMCRVVLDEEAWKEEVSSLSFDGINTNTSVDKSVLLMMVDRIEYMMRNDNLKATLNKASYAYRSNRELFIWIGNLDETELNRRELDSLELSNFGFECAPKTLGNSIHHYKPIAILALFDMLDGKSIFFMDADTDFSTLAFDRIENDKLQGEQGEKKDPLDPIGPESYLDISSQASLVGTQNTKGKMLMNSGLWVLRNTQWSRDFAALWWYARCGDKDQLALWLVLYATFSAWTTPTGDGSPVIKEGEAETPFQFAYSGKMLFNYDSASMKLFMHFRKYGHRLQAAWQAVVEQQQIESSGAEMDNNDSYDYPIPTNIKLYNGGQPVGIEPKLTGVMELPHVVILPQEPIHFNRTIERVEEEGTSAVAQVELLRFKSEKGIDSFVSHSKTLESCSDRRCWPYVKD